MVANSKSIIARFCDRMIGGEGCGWERVVVVAGVVGAVAVPVES